MDRILSRNTEKDLYSILGCDELSTTEQILTEYKVRALALHPDKAISPSPEAFSQLQRAKTVLSDPQQRKEYDQWRHSGIAIPFDEWLARKDKICLHWASTENKKKMLVDSGEADKSKFTSEFNRHKNSDIINAFRNYRI